MGAACWEASALLVSAREAGVFELALRAGGDERTAMLLHVVAEAARARAEVYIAQISEALATRPCAPAGACAACEQAGRALA